MRILFHLVFALFMLLFLALALLLDEKKNVFTLVLCYGAWVMSFLMYLGSKCLVEKFMENEWAIFSIMAVIYIGLIVISGFESHFKEVRNEKKADLFSIARDFDLVDL